MWISKYRNHKNRYWERTRKESGRERNTQRGEQKGRKTHTHTHIGLLTDRQTDTQTDKGMSIYNFWFMFELQFLLLFLFWIVLAFIGIWTGSSGESTRMLPCNLEVVERSKESESMQDCNWQGGTQKESSALCSVDIYSLTINT